MGGTSVAGLAAGTYYARTINTQGYRDKVFNNLAFCDPSCQVTDGAPITVHAGTATSGVDFVLAAGTELVQNSGFSSGLDAWSLYATPDNSYLASQVVGGVFTFSRVNPPPGTGEFCRHPSEHSGRYRDGRSRARTVRSRQLE